MHWIAEPAFTGPKQTGPAQCAGPIRFVKISTLIVLPLPDTADGTGPTLARISYPANLFPHQARAERVDRTKQPTGAATTFLVRRSRSTTCFAEPGSAKFDAPA
jgi:hypothetical protein